MSEQPPPSRTPWDQVRAALEAEGFRPSKSLGQNFLLDTNMLRSIARDSGVQAGEFVLEVGPGCGFLTGELLALGARLLCVEIDARLARIVRRFHPVAFDTGQARLIQTDVLASKHEIAPEVRDALPGREPWALVSNLPYNAAGPILVGLARLSNPPRTMCVLIQREHAERLVAREGTRAWGPLAARLALTYKARTLRRVPAQLFWPRPRVESAVVRLDLLPERPEVDPGRFDALVEVLFQSRRKALRRALGPLLGAPREAARRLEELGWDADRRPDQLAREELIALCRVL